VCSPPVLTRSPIRGSRSEDAAALIHQTSRGYPRAVNNLALQAQLAAFATNKSIVDESSARAAVTETTTE